MKCEKCGMKLPNDSEFCQYCGKPIRADDNEHIISESEYKQLPIEEAPINAEESEEIKNDIIPAEEGSFKKDRRHKKSKEKQVRYCKKCGGMLEQKTRKCLSCGAQPIIKKHRALIPITALSVVAAILLGLCIYQFIYNNGNSEKITTLESRVNSLQSQGLVNSKTISDLRTQNTSLQEKSDLFDSICNYGSIGSFGYAADHFHANTGLVVMTEGSTKAITLTAHWSNGGTVDYDYYGHSALISLDNDSWYTSTTATIHAYSKGVTRVCFTNDVDNYSFSIIIIVK